MKTNYNGNFATNFLAVFAKSMFALAFMLFSFVTLFAGDVDVTVEDCNGNSLAGATFWVHNGVTYEATQVIPGTTVSVTDGNTYSVYAMYNNTVSQPISFTAHSGTNAFDFTTTNVHITWNGSHLNYGGVNGLISFPKTNGVWGDLELFPYIQNSIYGTAGPIPVQFNARVTYNVPQFSLPIVVSGCSVTYSPIILHLEDHNGNPLSGAHATGVIGSGYVFNVPGVTDFNGNLVYLPNGTGTMSFTMAYNGTWQTMTHNGTSNPLFNFQTAQLKVRLETCSGDPVDGGHVRFKSGTYKYWLNSNVWGNSNTGNLASGEVGGEVFPGTYDVDMHYTHVENTNTSVVVTTTGGMTTFKTTSVALSYSGNITYKTSPTGYIYSYSAPSMEMLPGNYEFIFGGNPVPVTVGSCVNPINYTAVILNVDDHNGNPLAGAHARGQIGSGYWFHVGGSSHVSGSNGTIVYLGNGSGNMTFEMRYNGTTQTITQDVNANSIFNFQTAVLKVRLETCSGSPIDGGHVRFKSGLYKRWLNNGNWANSSTGNSASGEVIGEVFPGSYNVDIQYKKGENTHMAVVVTAMGGMDTFKTTNVNLNYSGPVTYKNVNNQYAAWYTQPSMELLPGDYIFTAYGGASAPVTVGGCANPVSLNFTRVKLIDSYGNGLPDGVLEYWDGAWHYASAPSDANGNILLLTSSNHSSLKMWYRGGHQQFNGTGSMTGVITYQTIKVTGSLLSSQGVALSSNLKFFALTWQDLDPINASGTSAEGQLLPGNYNFDFKYDGMHTGNILQDVSVNSHVTSSTVLASFCSEITSFYAGWWHNNVGSSYEMIPGNYWFKYNGAPQVLESVMTSGNYGCIVVANKRDVNDDETNTIETTVKTGVYPNPFTETATFSFELDETMNVKIEVYDLSGKLVKTVVNSEFTQGSNQVQWNGDNDSGSPLSTGVYFYRIEAGSSLVTDRIIRTK